MPYTAHRMETGPRQNAGGLMGSRGVLPVGSGPGMRLPESLAGRGTDRHFDGDGITEPQIV